MWHIWAQSGWTALTWAAMHGKTDCARLLLDAGADTNATDEVRASAGCCVRGDAVVWGGETCFSKDSNFFGRFFIFENARL